jgi:hypothetical protein
VNPQSSAEQLELPGVPRKSATRPWSPREVLVTVAAGIVLVPLLLVVLGFQVFLGSHQAAPAQPSYDGRISSMSTAQVEALATSLGWKNPPGVFDATGIESSAHRYISTEQDICLQHLGGPGGYAWTDGQINWSLVPGPLRSTCGSVLTSSGERR